MYTFIIHSTVSFCWKDKVVPSASSSNGGEGEGGLLKNKLSQYRTGLDGFELVQKTLFDTANTGNNNDYEVTNQ